MGESCIVGPNIPLIMTFGDTECHLMSYKLTSSGLTWAAVGLIVAAVVSELPLASVFKYVADRFSVFMQHSMR